MSRELPQDVRDAIERSKRENPELIAKYGDPSDENDPRFWTPSERAERGVSLEDRVKYLELDQEMSMLTLGPVLQWVMQKKAEEMAEQMRRDPVAFLRNALESGADPKLILSAITEAQNGSSHEDASSNHSLAPDTLVETVQGKIRADQIPGYRDDPDWQPSPDWIDANCVCERHQAMRAASEGKRPDDGDYSTGLYL